MNNQPKWEFASTGGSPDEGIHNSMIEHFAGNYNYHLAREIIQNSLDAKLENSNKPAVVQFKLENFTQAEIPRHSQMQEILQKCNDYWIDEETREFMQKAIRCISQEHIPVLKISDYNTKGLSGDDYQKDGTWYKLVKSRGSSSKVGGEGGSFGIGKGAPFAASDLRIVFYSTKNEAEDIIFQGIAELVSFKDNNDIKRGIGSFGKNQQSLRVEQDLPSPRFRRQETGTDIYIIGYKNSRAWDKDLLKSVLRNFWYAIFQNELEVIIQNTLINQSNLEEHLVQNFFGEAYRDDLEPFGNPLQYYLAVTKGRLFTTSLKEVGHVSFYFFETDEYLNHVAMMRKSHMVIFSRNFRFPSSYAGVFICDDERGNHELRKMEPPAHDKWIVGRSPVKGKKVFEEVTTFIKQCLEKSKAIRKNEVLEIPDMEKYLPDNEESESDPNSGQSKKYSGSEAIQETSQLVQKSEAYPTPVNISPFKISIINKKIGLPTDDDYDYESTGTKKKKKKRPNLKTDSEIQFRIFNSSRSGNKYEYTVIMKSKKTGKYTLKLFAIGEDISEKLIISDISQINGKKHAFSGNMIKDVLLVAQEETRFKLYVNAKFKTALKIEVNEVQ
jgi:hypothetical protein